MVYTNLLSLLLIIYRYNYNTSVTCSATMWMFSCVLTAVGVILRLCWSSLVIALQSNDSSTGVHPHCWMWPIPSSYLYHPLSSMWVKQRLYHKKMLHCCRNDGCRFEVLLKNFTDTTVISWVRPDRALVTLKIGVAMSSNDNIIVTCNLPHFVSVLGSALEQ